MPITTRWYQPDKILLIEYQGILDSDDLVGAMREVVDYLNASPHKLHFISTLEKLESSPIAPATIPELVKIMRHKNAGINAIVKATPFINHWLEILKTIGFNALPFASVEEAAAYLETL